MTKIAGFVLRCKSRKNTAEFYTKLGLTTTEHMHGGPLHFEVQPTADDLAVELYNASEKYPRDTIMIMVNSVKKSLIRLKKLGVAPKSSVITNENYMLIYITDPDRRDVMLFQRKKKKTKRK